MKRFRQQGFTLVELVVALAIGMVVLAAIYNVVQTGLRSSSSLERKVTAGQDVRAALELMAMEIRMASYNPNFATGMWINQNGTLSALQESKGIQQATANSILIEMDVNGNSMIDYPSDECILYSLDTANRYIIRNIGSNQPFLGALPGSTQERTVRVINGDLNIPVFTYYDGKGDVIPAATFPAALENIRRIEIVLAVETDDIDINSGQRKRMIYSTSIIPRNHVSSP